MQQFIGTKIISAKPMTRLEYNQYRGWQLPDDEDGNDAGMLVEYHDGGAPNHPGHKGYISWSPKDVFDAAYIGMGEVAHLEAWKQRVVGEKAALDEKLGKLDLALDNAENQLYMSDKVRNQLDRQANAMRIYSNILAERIAAF